MLLLRKFRFSMALVMMLVVTAAAASALFVKLYQNIDNQIYFRTDRIVLFLLSIVLTAVALGAIKSHSIGQTMVQITVACLGYVSLFGLVEIGSERPFVYWFEINFGLLVTTPLLARRFVKTEMKRGPKRTLWKKRLESISFAFLTMGLVLVELMFRNETVDLINQILDTGKVIRF